MNEPIELAPAIRRRDRQRAQNSSSSLVDGVRERLLAHLRGALAVLFEQADDTLFQLADQSDNNTEQNRYFDAMREVRLQRSKIEQRFLDACTEHFFRDCAAGDEDRRPAMSSGEPSLSLVDNDELEESLAIDNLVEKLEADHADALYALDQRMASLRQGETGGVINPAAPRRLCEAFREAGEGLDTDIAVRLLIFKLFDRFVAATLGDCYASINTYLAAEGVLPKIGGRPSTGTTVRRPSKRPPAANHADPVAAPDAHGEGDAANPAATGVPASPTVGTGTAAGAASATSGSFSAADMLEPPTGFSTGGTGGPAVAGGASAVSAGDLLATLHQVMTAQGARALSEEAAASGGATLEMLTGLQHGVRQDGAGAAFANVIDPALLSDGTTNVIRVLRETALGEDTGRVDGMMIDIVAMLFDSILDDPGIAGPMKALIGRLQIPVLKVAILDKTFFSRKFHPARALLNKLAEAALGADGDAGEADPLYVTIDDIVHRILDDFEDDVRVFKRALQELDTYLANEEREAESRMEQVLNEIQAEERLRFARKLAGEQVAPYLEDSAVPAIVREFLDVYWKSFLQLAYIDGGEEGEQWRDSLQTMDDLVWSLTPKADAEERQRLKEMLPTLPVRLKEGMSQVPMSDDFRNRFLATLVQLHLAAIRPPESVAGGAGPIVDDVPVVADEANPSDAEVADPGAFFDPTGESGNDAANSIGLPATDNEEAEVAPPAEGPSVDDAGSDLRAAIEEANRQIFDTAASRPECEGMGTTVVSAQFADGEITMAHVGDSRLYRLRDGEFDQLTSDHSLRQELVDQGFLTPEEARHTTRKNYVTRAVGIDGSVQVDVDTAATQPGDVYLLCSDGLCDMVEDADMVALLETGGSELDDLTRQLVERANENGGKDNISVILVAIADAHEISMSALTDVGRTRSHNEDFVACDARAGLAVLADGMGGYNAGEVASELAVTTVMAKLGAAIVQAGATDDGEVDINEMLFGEADVDVEAIEIGLPESNEDSANGSAEAAPVLEDTDDFPPLDTSPGEADDGIEEIVIHDVGGVVLSDDRYAEAAQALTVGDWVQFERETSGRIRARLTWISSATGNFLFTNRQGHKVADTTPQGLAVEFRRGTARKLESAPLFDRAVSSLMDRLRGDTADAWG